MIAQQYGKTTRRPSARDRFNETLQTLARRSDKISDPVFLSLALSALADLAADYADPSMEHTREILVLAAKRLERIAARRSLVKEPIGDWRRMVSLAADTSARDLRLRAIKDAEFRLRSHIESTPLSLPLAGYRSSSISQ